jgi:ribonuclease D
MASMPRRTAKRVILRDRMHPRHPTPDKDQIALLEPFERLGLDRIALVATARQAHGALEELAREPVWGFDTESKPTFFKDQSSDGPHVVQLATARKAWVFQLHDGECAQVVARLLAMSGVIKAGFGLDDDRKRITRKLGLEPAGVLELNTVFRDRGYRKDMGVRGAVAVMFNRRFVKSRKATTSNWANPRLTEAQLLYAANDAYAAVRVFHALELAAETEIRT